jgi:ribosome biogenesis GTPase A
MEYQWYPGHMAKAKKDIKESLKLVDVIIELIDARIPYSSKNPDIDELAGNKPRVLLINKADLADDRVTAEFKSFYEEKGYFVIVTNAKNGNLKPVMNVVRDACKEKIERDKARGMINRPIRAMILGIPNVGKSTFINSYAKKACTKTGDKPGVTTGKQWIRLSKELELLDTPGILWPKFEDEVVGRNLALIGSINDEVISRDELCEILLEYMNAHYPDSLDQRYGGRDMDAIAARLGCVGKGGEFDHTRACKGFLDDFRSGRLGRINLEVAP